MDQGILLHHLIQGFQHFQLARLVLCHPEVQLDQEVLHHLANLDFLMILKVHLVPMVQEVQLVQ